MSNRLRLRQAHKVSFKNDFTEFAITQTLSVHETLVLHTVDVVCAAISYLFGCCEKTGEDASLVERTVDLSPIKRLTPDGAERRWKVPCLHQSVQPYKGKLVTKGNWSIFQAQLLPFGAVKSVNAFLCLARAGGLVQSVATCFGPPSLTTASSSHLRNLQVVQNFQLLRCLNFWVGSSLKMGGSAIFLLFVVKP